MQKSKREEAIMSTKKEKPESKPEVQDYVLTKAELPKRKAVYQDIIRDFEESGEDVMLLSGPITERVKVATLITSLTTAKKGKPIMVRRKGANVYLQRR